MLDGNHEHVLLGQWWQEGRDHTGTKESLSSAYPEDLCREWVTRVNEHVPFYWG